MELEEKLYGWDDGKLYFMSEEHGQVCVTDESELLRELISLCEEYFAVHSPGKEEAQVSFEPEVSEEVTACNGATFNLEEISEYMFEMNQYGETRGLLNPETGTLVHDMEHEPITENICSEMSEEERETLNEAGIVPEGWFVLEGQPTHESWEFMRDFARTISNSVTRDRVMNALQGRGAFRGFRDIINSDERMRQRWYAFKTDRERREAFIMLVFDCGLEFPEDVHEAVGVEAPFSASDPDEEDG